MRIILQEDIKNLGKAGEVINVAPGYARNYLIPRKLALLASESNMKNFEQRQKARIKTDAKNREQALVLADQLEKVTIKIARRTGEHDVLYGSVTAMDIAEALLAEKIEIDKKKIQLDEPIKSLGPHTVPIKLHSEVTAQLVVNVEKEQ